MLKSLDEWQEPTTIWNKVFLSVFFANIAYGISQFSSNSMLSVYADSLGAPASQIGILMSMFALTALIFRFVAGPAMDAFNRKYLLIFSMAIMATAYIGFSFSRNISSLLVFRLFQGIGNAFGYACCLAIVADALPKDQFNTGIGYFSVAQAISQAIGPSVGLQLVSRFGYSNTYLINAGMMGFAIFSAFVIKLPPRKPKAFNLNLSNIIAKEALVPSAVTFFVAMGFTTINALLIVSAKKQGVTDGIGLFFTVYALTMLATRPIIGKLTDRFGFVKVGIPAIFMTALSFIIISQSHVLWMFLLAAFVSSFGYGAAQPTLQSLAMKSVPADRRGSASSTNYIGMDSATLIGPTVAGFVAQKFGYTPMWIIMTIPFAIGILFVFSFRSNIKDIEKKFSTKVVN